MQHYITTNEMGLSYSIQAHNLTEARHWIINHLDTSHLWHLYEIDGPPELLIMAINGLELGKVFAEFYAPFILNSDCLEEEITALLQGEANPDYALAWYIVKRDARVEVQGCIQSIFELRDGNLYCANDMMTKAKHFRKTNS